MTQRYVNLALAALLAGGCEEATPHPQPDDHGLECDPSLANTCSSGMDCVPLGEHNNPIHDFPDDIYTCATHCESELDCPDNHCEAQLRNDGSTQYPCAEDGYCIVAWCTSNCPYE